MKEHETDEELVAMLGLAIGMGGGSASEIVDMMEKGGQSALNRVPDQLPRCRNAEYNEILEAMGVKIGKPVEGDTIFVHVELPQGWSKKATNHALYSDLLDEKGRKRAEIMYKAAFYDRDGRISPCQRFYATCKDLNWEDPTVEECYVPVIENSNGEVLWYGKPIVEKTGWRDEPLPYKDSSHTNEQGQHFYSALHHAQAEAHKVLVEVCPIYESDSFKERALAYWDEEPQWPESLNEAPKGEVYKVYVGLYRRSSDGWGGLQHVDSGHNCNVRAETVESAWEKAVKSTEHFQRRYDCLELSIRNSSGEVVKSSKFERPIVEEFIDYNNPYGPYGYYNRG